MSYIYHNYLCWPVSRLNKVTATALMAAQPHLVAEKWPSDGLLLVGLFSSWLEARMKVILDGL